MENPSSCPLKVRFIPCSPPAILVGVGILQHPCLPSEDDRTQFCGSAFSIPQDDGASGRLPLSSATCLGEGMSSIRPVFAVKAANTLKLASVGRYQYQPTSERLSGDQQVVGSDRATGGLKLAADGPSGAGVSGVEHNGLERHPVQQFEVACCVLAFVSPIVELEEHWSRQTDVSRRMPTRSHRQHLRSVVEKGDASVCVQKIPHHSNARPMSRSMGIFG